MGEEVPSLPAAPTGAVVPSEVIVSFFDFLFSMMMFSMMMQIPMLMMAMMIPMTVMPMKLMRSMSEEYIA